MSSLEDILALTSALIRYRSTDTRPEERDRCAAHIMRWCDAEDIASSRVDNNGVTSLIIGPASKRAPLLFMAHYDIDKENTLVAAKEGRGGRGVDCKFGVGRCKLLHSEWIKQQDHRAQRWFRC